MENHSNLHPLFQELLAAGGFNKHIHHWPTLAADHEIGDESMTPRRRGIIAKKRWYRFVKRGKLEFKQATMNKKGEVVSYKVGRASDPSKAFDPEKIKGARLKGWTGNPHGGMWPKYDVIHPDDDGSLTIEDVKKIVKEAAKQPFKVKDWKRRDEKIGYTQIVSLGDAHIGMAADDNIFNLNWNEKELFKRASKLLKYIDEDSDELILIFGGDIADGLKGKTNRGGHDLPQNLSDKEQLQVSKDFVLFLLDGIVNITDAKVKVKFVTNSNHPGILDYATAEIVSTVAPYRYDGQVDFLIEEKFFGHFKINGTNHIFTHGYDSTMMKRGMPRFLKPNHIELIEKYMDHIKVKKAFLWRYDQHQSSKIVYKRFTDIMTPAFSNPSSWVALNFNANYKGGFVTSTLSKKGEMSYQLVEF